MQKPISRQTLFSAFDNPQSSRFKKVSRKQLDFPNQKKPNKISKRNDLPSSQYQVSKDPYIQHKRTMEKLIKELTARKFGLQLCNATETQDNCFAPSQR
jgi:hypothetical protein